MSDYFIEFPPLDELQRMKKRIERSIGEIEFDIKRNERRKDDLLLDLKNAKNALISIQAYISEAEEGR
jgi:hypothetical protein